MKCWDECFDAMPCETVAMRALCVGAAMATATKEKIISAMARPALMAARLL